MHWSKPLDTGNPSGAGKSINTAPISNRNSTLVQSGKGLISKCICDGGLIEQASHGQVPSSLRQSTQSQASTGKKKYGYH